MTKHVVISGYYGYGNFGDEIILGVLVNHLQRLNLQITVLSNNPELTSKTYGIRSIKNFDMVNVMKEISNADILISGGGSLLQDVTSLKSLLYYSFIIKYAQICKKKTIIFAQGIGPLTREISQKLVLKVISKCDLVTVRDSKSYEFLRENNIRATLVSDPMYSVDISAGKKNGKVGVQLRAFKSVNEEFLNSLAKQIVLNFGEREIEIIALQESQDYEICKKFDKILKTIYPQIQTEIIHNLSNNDIVVKISELEYLIAMRFHALVAAIKSGVKPLAINYDAKVAKLAFEAFLPIIPLSGKEDFEPQFDKLKQVDPDSLLAFSRNKNFEWDVFSEIF